MFQYLGNDGANSHHSIYLGLLWIKPICDRDFLIVVPEFCSKGSKAGYIIGEQYG